MLPSATQQRGCRFSQPIERGAEEHRETGLQRQVRVLRRETHQDPGPGVLFSGAVASRDQSALRGRHHRLRRGRAGRACALDSQVLPALSRGERMGAIPARDLRVRDLPRRRGQPGHGRRAEQQRARRRGCGRGEAIEDVDVSRRGSRIGGRRNCAYAGRRATRAANPPAGNCRRSPAGRSGDGAQGRVRTRYRLPAARRPVWRPPRARMPPSNALTSKLASISSPAAISSCCLMLNCPLPRSVRPTRLGPGEALYTCTKAS